MYEQLKYRILGAILGFNITFVIYQIVTFNPDSDSFYLNMAMGAVISAVVAAVAWFGVQLSGG